jgi:uncharacterized protein (TIGR04141 family)
MPARPVPIRNLHIFLAKEEYRGAEQLLREPDSYDHQGVSTRDGFLGLLYMKPSRPRPPNWLRFFEGALDEPQDLPRLITSSASAVLILECAGRTFLLTFGFGRAMIEDGVVEPRFGLKATLNAIHPDKLRSIDSKSFERIQRLSREQLSRDSGFNAFGLNVEQDLLSAVVGTPEDDAYGRRLVGRDALSTFVQCNLEDLRTVLELYLELSEQDRYKQLFPWVDNIAEVSDKRTRTRLDEELCRMIRKQELSEIVLTPPDLIDWEEFDHFAYGSSGNHVTHTELLWDDYFREVRRPDQVTAETLRHDRVACARADGAGTLVTWSLRRCIAGELVLKDQRYVISEGKWYRIDQDFANRVVQSVRAIHPCTEALPAWAHADEDSYNRAAAQGSGGRWALMDKQMIQTRTGSIEFCDLFSDQKRMIHAKRHAGSAPLSHLFAQGVVAARLFQGDASFRSLVNAKLPPSHRLADPNAMIDPREYEVSYVVLGSPRRSIPFFSMVNLRGAVEILTGMNYSVSLTYV